VCWPCPVAYLGRSLERGRVVILEYSCQMSINRIREALSSEVRLAIQEEEDINSSLCSGVHHYPLVSSFVPNLAQA
jgi:hypothetical protein